MQKGFTAAEPNLNFPKDAKELGDQISNHLSQQLPNPTVSTQPSPFITLWSEQDVVENQITKLRSRKDGGVEENGYGENWRLYKIDGRKLKLLKVQMIHAQDVVDGGERGDDETYDKMYLVWSKIPRIAVVKEITYGKIKQKMLKELVMEPPETDGQQSSKGKAKGESIAADG
jgi:hypothetical protein